MNSNHFNYEEIRTPNLRPNKTIVQNVITWDRSWCDRHASKWLIPGWVAGIRTAIKLALGPTRFNGEGMIFFFPTKVERSECTMATRCHWCQYIDREAVPPLSSWAFFKSSLHTSSGLENCRTYTNMKYLWHARNDISCLMLVKREKILPRKLI